MKKIYAGASCLIILLSCASKTSSTSLQSFQLKCAELEKNQKKMETELLELSHQLMLMQSKLEYVSISPVSKSNAPVAPPVSTSPEVAPDKVKSQANFLGLDPLQGGDEKIKLTNESLKKLKPAPDFLGQVEKVDSVDAKKSYEDAQQVFRSKKYPQAIEKLQSFVAKYPQHRYSDSAIYWIAEGYFRQKKYEPAIQEFMQVLGKNPGEEKISDSLLKIGLSYKHLDRLPEAKETFARLQEKYPNSAAAKQAKLESAKLGHVVEGAAR